MSVTDWARIQSQAHQITAEAVVLDYKGAVVNTPPLTVERLSWALDAVGTPTMSATLAVPVEDTITNVNWAPANSNSPLTPFGNQIKVTLTIKGPGGTDSMILGTGVIETVTVARPENMITVQLTDRTDALVNSELAQLAPWTDKTLHSDRWWFRWMLAQARTPGPALQVVGLGNISDKYERSKVGEWTVGTSIMSILGEIAGRYSCWVWLNRDGKLEVKRGALTDDNPAASAPARLVISDGPGGSLLSLSSSVTRVGVVNRVDVFNTHPKTDAKTSANASTRSGPTRWPGTLGNRNRALTLSTKWDAKRRRKYARDQLKTKVGDSP